MVKQIQAARSDRLRQGLERQLEVLVKRMESKGEQIGKVRRHQAQVRLRAWRGGGAPVGEMFNPQKVQ